MVDNDTYSGTPELKKALYGNNNAADWLRDRGRSKEKDIVAGTREGKEMPDVLSEHSGPSVVEPQVELDLDVFSKNDTTEIVIPASVLTIKGSVFRRSFQPQVEKLTIQNPNLQIKGTPFEYCRSLQEINWENGMDPIEKYQVLGLPFLATHLDDEANLNHTDDSRFSAYVERCGEGDAWAMYEFGDFFEEWACKPNASPFYQHAANFWHFRSSLRGCQKAKDWFVEWVEKHPGRRIPSVLAEYGEQYYLECPYRGQLLQDLGLPFFDGKTKYDLSYQKNGVVIEARSYADSDDPDDTGFGGEDYYWWWILDWNFSPIPGVSKIHASVREKTNSRSLAYSRFSDAYHAAAEYRKSRCF